MIKRYVSLSRDGRTNVWEITCDCGRSFRPGTTMYNTQLVTCPKCKKEEVMDYNHYAPEDNVPEAFREMERAEKARRNKRGR